MVGEDNCAVLLDGATLIGNYPTATKECFDFHSGPAPPSLPPSPPAIPGSVFRYVPNLMTRAEAQAHCMTMDTRYGLPSHLASVQNDNENAQVLELCQASSSGLGCWLGYSSSAADNASALWAWDDQTELGYTNWDRGIAYDWMADDYLDWNEPLQLSLESGNTVGAVMQTLTADKVIGSGLVQGRTKGKWAAADPSLRRPFVCLEKYVEPPSPPAPPGARTIYGLSLELMVSGDVASFDRQAFTESLARDLGVDASSVILTLRPGSAMGTVVVFAAIPYTTLPSFSDREIQSMSNAAASAAMANVEKPAEVTMGAVMLDAPSPSPPPSPPPSLPPLSPPPSPSPPPLSPPPWSPPPAV